MADIRTYTHPEDGGKTRADKALSAFFGSEVSRTRLEESFRSGKVTLAGKAIQKRHLLSPGDVLTVQMPHIPAADVSAVDIPVPVLYEDDDVVAVNKPAGMTVHPGSGTEDDTLVHAMLHHCKGKLSLAGGALRPGIVHRLDKGTSGVMIMAKTDKAYYNLVSMFSRHELLKEYLALVSGVPNVRSGVIEKPIARHPTFRTKMCVSESGGREARTDWRVEERFGTVAALVSCRIATGRTHQIRVHMSSIGFPLLGDYTYSFQKNKLKTVPSPERAMLHSFRLALQHPVEEDKFLDIRAEPPHDFTQLIEELREAYA